MSYQRKSSSAAVSKPASKPAGKGGVAQKDRKFTYVNADLTELLDFIAGTIESGETVHVNVENGSLRFRAGEICYSKRLKAMEDGSFYGTIKPEEALSTAEFSAFQRRETI